jgi:hypothetical protein
VGGQVEDVRQAPQVRDTNGVAGVLKTLAPKKTTTKSTTCMDSGTSSAAKADAA